MIVIMKRIDMISLKSHTDIYVLDVSMMVIRIHVEVFLNDYGLFFLIGNAGVCIKIEMNMLKFIEKLEYY